MTSHKQSQPEPEARAAAQRVNAHLQRQLWYELEVFTYTGDTLLVCGGVDVYVSYDIQLRFQGVFFLSTPMEWRVDTQQPPMSVLLGEAAWEVNQRFQVEQGHHLFAFQPEDHPPGALCLIGAKRLEVEIHAPKRRMGGDAAV